MIGPDSSIEKLGQLYETLNKWKPQSLTFEQFYLRATAVSRPNVFSIDRPKLVKLIEAKEVQVTEIITSHTFSKWLKRASIFFVLALGVMLAVGIILAAVRG